MAEGGQGRGFVVMPFGRKPAPAGAGFELIDFDAVYRDLLAPAIAAAGLAPYRADSSLRAGSIHSDMFQDLLLADFVVADLTIDNPNAWYEIGVRHALRARGAVLTFALRDRLPFDLNGQRMIHYDMVGGVPDPAKLEQNRATLTAAIVATQQDWRERKASPVYAMLPNLQEPDWKTLKVGGVQEYWQQLDAWESRIKTAAQKNLPGDILTLVDETPSQLLGFEALLTAGKALLRMNRPIYALSTLRRARELNPDDVVAWQQEAVALGRNERFAEAVTSLKTLEQEQEKAGRRSGETLGLIARTRKDDWKQRWTEQRAHGLDALAAAKATSIQLGTAATAYADAFRASPAEYYPGINALSFGRLRAHVTGTKPRIDLDLLAGGVSWALACARKDYWSLVSRAELHVVQGDRDAAMEALEEAVADALAPPSNRFGLDSTLQTLEFMAELDFRSEIVAEAKAMIEGALAQLDPPKKEKEPANVVLFSGHMVDMPDRATPRFPPAKVDAAAAKITAALDEIGASEGDLGIAQAARGGDLLFARACLARGMRLLILLPFEQPEFLQRSVASAGQRWFDDFDAVVQDQRTTLRIMPRELGPVPEGADAFERCNRWLLHTALSQGVRRLSFVALWDGGGGDGPGGTEHMVKLVRQLTGREPQIIDPAEL